MVCGASGRLGRRICALALADGRFALSAALTHPASHALGTPVAPGQTLRFTADAPAALTPGLRADCVLACPLPEGVPAALALALRLHTPLLVATTGLPAATTDALRAAATTIPVLVAPNTSLGIAVLTDLATRAARALGPGYTASIVEAHHDQKKDAPSGTARRLALAVEAGGGDVSPDHLLSLRSGDVVGEHTLRFAGPGEYLELTHRATTRDLFAQGALRAALWLRGKAPGWHAFTDTLA